MQSCWINAEQAVMYVIWKLGGLDVEWTLKLLFIMLILLNSQSKSDCSNPNLDTCVEKKTWSIPYLSFIFRKREWRSCDPYEHEQYRQNHHADGYYKKWGFSYCIQKVRFWVLYKIIAGSFLKNKKFLQRFTVLSMNFIRNCRS